MKNGVRTFIARQYSTKKRFRRDEVFVATIVLGPAPPYGSGSRASVRKTAVDVLRAEEVIAELPRLPPVLCQVTAGQHRVAAIAQIVALLARHAVHFQIERAPESASCLFWRKS